jgi:putative ubiquitin-RnfH superfamily antitoxin RatB of RatAB toxin-antitoxin module
MKVEVILAWPRRHAAVTLELPDGATLGDAVQASGLPLDGIVAYAVHGVRAEPAQPLRDGDRVELLRPLQADPKEQRRKRAAGGKGQGAR